MLLRSSDEAKKSIIIYELPLLTSSSRATFRLDKQFQWPRAWNEIAHIIVFLTLAERAADWINQARLRKKERELASQPIYIHLPYLFCTRSLSTQLSAPHRRVCVCVCVCVCVWARRTLALSLFLTHGSWLAKWRPYSRRERERVRVWDGGSFLHRAPEFPGCARWRSRYIGRRNGDGKGRDKFLPGERECFDFALLIFGLGRVGADFFFLVSFIRFTGWSIDFELTRESDLEGDSGEGYKYNGGIRMTWLIWICI